MENNKIQVDFYPKNMSFRISKSINPCFIDFYFNKTLRITYPLFEKDIILSFGHCLDLFKISNVKIVFRIQNEANSIYKDIDPYCEENWNDDEWKIFQTEEWEILTEIKKI